MAGRCVRNTQARTVQLQGISKEMFEKYREAFVREAKTLAALHHPNIVEVIDVFDENNTSYMVMPFIEGCTLQNTVEKKGPLSYSEAVNYLAQITNAVGYIHERNILHRDIKPENIMITDDYKAILIDFGSAREFEHDKTQMHTAMLTHGYAPTEQYTANSRKGSYTDIYSIGATLYFVLTGRVPLEAAARMTERMPEPRELNPNIPEEMNRTILKAMQLKAENRHQTVKDFMDDLRNIRPSELVDETIGSKSIVVVRKNKKWIWWVIAVAVAVISGLSIAIFMNVKQHQQKVEAEMRKQEKKIHELDSTYDKAIREFDFHVNRINISNDMTNPTHVIEAMDRLKEIENIEKDDLFSKTGNEYGLEKRIALYTQKIKDEKSKIVMEIEDLNSKGLGEGPFFDTLCKKEFVISRILEQISPQSVSQVKMKPSAKMDNSQK